MKSLRLRRMLASPWAIGALVVLLLVLLAPPLSFIEVRALDELFRLVPSDGLDPNIEVIDVGEPAVYEDESLGIGKCPESPEGCEIPRKAYAETVRRLSRWGAKVIVFDLMFRRSCEAEDPDLAQAFRDAGNVVVAATTMTKTDAVSLKRPVEPLDGAVWAVGSPVANKPGNDVRMIPLLVRDRDSGSEYLALSLLALQGFMGREPTDMELTEDGYLAAADRKIPVVDGETIYLLPFMGVAEAEEADADDVGITVESGSAQVVPGLRTWNALIINWCGPAGTIEPHLLPDVLQMSDELGATEFGGKAVIVGRRSWDEHWTAVGAMAGPDIQANALHTLMSGSFIRPIPRWAFLFLALIFAVPSSWCVRRIKAVRTIFVALLLVALSLALSRELLVRSGIWSYLVFCNVAIALSWGITSSAQSGRLGNLLQRFVPAFMRGEEQRALGDIRTRDASILYSDIRNYTTISEKLGAETTLRLLGPYRTSVENIVTGHGGAIVITPGDAVLAVFWQDHEGTNHPTCAVRAGREILDRMPELAQDWEAADVALQVGVGVNSGPVAMGFLGDQNLEATVIGDAVNLSQRLESLTKELGYPLILSASVQSRLKDDVEAVFIDELTVKGRKLPVEVYGVVGPSDVGGAPAAEADHASEETVDES